MKLNQTPGTLDIEIRRGDTFNKLVTISDTDLTGYELSAGALALCRQGGCIGDE